MRHAIAIVLLTLGLSGCGTVHPWERGRLASPAMAEVAEPERAAFDAHVAGAREAALDPGGAGGGGCGCN